MDKEEKFCLKWNDYRSNLEKSFQELRKDALLLDVTLACEDQQIEAHRVVTPPAFFIKNPFEL